MDIQLVIFLNRQMNAKWHRLFESITLFPCNTGSGIFTQKASGGEIDSLSKETIVLYLNIERPIVPLSGSQRLWHFSGVKPSWSIRCFFCYLLFFGKLWQRLSFHLKGNEWNCERSLRAAIISSLGGGNCLYILSFWRVRYTPALFFFKMNILVSWIKSCF